MPDEATPDLAATDLIPIVDGWLKALPERDEGSLLWVERDEVIGLRAALERLKKLEAALGRADRHLFGCSAVNLGAWSNDCDCGWGAIKALLPRSAEEGGKRG